MKTKKVPCSYVDCGSRRRHWEEPYTPRGKQMMEVPEDQKGPYFCSLTCAIYAGHFSLRDGWIKKDTDE